ncbi:MAG TPA: DUF72 domain-containing protein [Caulobacteraceae bacterium]|jgi:uncharacterized protein YecE (DUF72 family)
MAGAIRVGIGGWTFAPWRGSFYPSDLKQKDELAFAARTLTALEINGTYYSGFKAQTFAGWASQAPEGFIFTAKANRFCTNRRVLADAGESVGRFFAQGIDALGERLGPILWQFAHTKKFDADDIARFLELLPEQLAGRRLRHALEVRHESFHDERFVELARGRGVAICLADHPVYPMIEEPTADFVYARLMRGDENEPTCYPPAEIKPWAERLSRHAADGRDVFAFFISGGKPRAPFGAQAMQEALGLTPWA